ncbi:MAG: hypothetical protein ACE5ED_00760 [Rhodothalassiaceae bacterium]
MLRIHGLSGEQLGALLRLMADNQSFEDIDDAAAGKQSFEDIDDAAAGSKRAQGGTAPGQAVPALPTKGGIARWLRLVQG